MTDDMKCGFIPQKSMTDTFFLEEYMANEKLCLCISLRRKYDSVPTTVVW